MGNSTRSFSALRAYIAIEFVLFVADRISGRRRCRHVRRRRSEFLAVVENEPRVTPPVHSSQDSDELPFV